MSGQKSSSRKVRRSLSSLVLVSGAMVMVVAGAQPASAALDCQNAPPPAPHAINHDYTVAFGSSLTVPMPGLLVGSTPSTGLQVETTSSPIAHQFNPSDTESFWAGATITYAAHSGGFTYKPFPVANPADAFSGEDSFDYTLIDACDNEAFATANVKVVPTVVDATYTATANTPLNVAAPGFLAHDKGVDAASLTYDSTTVHHGTVDDNLASDGSFVYTPAPGFFGADSFTYTVPSLDDNDFYTKTVHLNVVGPPAAPTGVTAKASGSTAIVNWTTPLNHGSAIKTYTVTASPGGKSVTGATKPLTIKGLSRGTTYTFRVSAKNALGVGPLSAPSNAVTIVSSQSTPRVGYWMLATNGRVYGFGDAGHFNHPAKSGVAIAPRLDGTGYWTVDAAGTVSAFGTARGHGGNPPLRPGEIVSTLSATPSGNGYWLFTNRGRVFPFGDAHFKGDLSGTALNGPIVASVATPTGNGYFMVGSDGGVFSFGDARFHGSTGGIHLNQPIVGISPTANNAGYWLVASDGGVFAFNAPFRGSMGGAKLSKPVNGLVAYGNGYLMVASDGGVFDFSNKSFLGSLASNPPIAPIIGIAAFATS